MSISGIGSSSYYQTQMSTMGNRSSPQEMFNKIDQDGSGGLDQTEFSTLADKIAEATGQEVDVEELFASYDADGDGVLNQQETDTAMAANRPKGPPPPPPNSEESNSVTSLRIENYLKMAALETDDSSLTALLSGTTGYQTQLSVNTRA